jgi:hypothetical protein
MLLKQITEARVSPDVEFMDQVEQILDLSIEEYGKYLDDNNDVDDIFELEEILNSNNDNNLPIEFIASAKERQDPNEWISAMAGIDKKGPFMEVYLFSKNLEGRYGPKTFKQIVMRMLAHETIHWNQYRKIGLNKVDKIKSGHQKGTEIAKRTGNQMDWMREYLKDPHELMAYASDLASEIKDLENPEQVLRNPEAHKQDLPSYARYRQVFEPNSREIRQLLKYTADYYSN